MKKSNKLKLVMLAFAIAFFSLSSASFAKSWPSKSIENPLKPWKITFSQPVDQNAVTDSNIYILDGKTKIPVNLNLNEGNRTITIAPKAPYEAGREYQLKVDSALKSESGRSLNEPASLKFHLIDKSKAIQSITESSAYGFTNLTVLTRSDVHKVKANTTEMQLSGFNKFSQGFYGLSAGSKVTIRAYDSNGRVLETIPYILD